MRPLLLILLLATPASTSFGGGQGAGAWVADAPWTEIVVAAGMAAHFTVTLPAGTVVENRTETFVTTNALVQAPAQAPDQDTQVTLGHPLTLFLTSSNRDATLFVVGRPSTQFSGRAELVAPPRGDLFDLAPAAAQRSHAAQSWPIPEPIALARSSEGSFSLNVTDVSHLSWQGFRTTCDSDPCPQSRTTEENAGSSGIDLQVERLTFEATSGPAVVTGGGAALATLAGGAALDLSLDGWIRLPTYSPADGRTLQATGHVTLGDLHPAGDGRLAANVGGALASARLDETPVSPVLLGFGAATAAVAVAGLWLVLKLLGGTLFTKLGKDPLVHPRRMTIYGYIRDHPGATFREVVRGGLAASGTTRHHLNILCRHGLVVERRHHHTLRFFENHGRFDADWADVVVLREPSLRVLQDWLQGHPGAHQREVVAGMATLGWSRSTSQHRLRRLVDAGLVSVRPQGRLNRYQARSP
ncbi:MAG: winged helix-turn-helix transcriptional regulator [Thermoplasmatota archaeon]